MPPHLPRDALRPHRDLLKFFIDCALKMRLEAKADVQHLSRIQHAALLGTTDPQRAAAAQPLTQQAAWQGGADGGAASPAAAYGPPSEEVKGESIPSTDPFARLEGGAEASSSSSAAAGAPEGIPGGDWAPVAAAYPPPASTSLDAAASVAAAGSPLPAGRRRGSGVGKRPRWKEEELGRLSEVMERLGPAAGWEAIAAELGTGRTPTAVHSQWRIAQREKKPRLGDAPTVAAATFGGTGAGSSAEAEGPAASSAEHDSAAAAPATAQVAETHPMAPQDECSASGSEDEDDTDTEGIDQAIDLTPRLVTLRTGGYLTGQRVGDGAVGTQEAGQPADSADVLDRAVDGATGDGIGASSSRTAGTAAASAAHEETRAVMAAEDACSSSELAAQTATGTAAAEAAATTFAAAEAEAAFSADAAAAAAAAADAAPCAVFLVGDDLDCEDCETSLHRKAPYLGSFFTHDSGALSTLADAAGDYHPVYSGLHTGLHTGLPTGLPSGLHTGLHSGGYSFVDSFVHSAGHDGDLLSGAPAAVNQYPVNLQSLQSYQGLSVSPFVPVEPGDSLDFPLSTELAAAAARPRCVRSAVCGRGKNHDGKGGRCNKSACACCGADVCVVTGLTPFARLCQNSNQGRLGAPAAVPEGGGDAELWERGHDDAPGPILRLGYSTSAAAAASAESIEPAPPSSEAEAEAQAAAATSEQEAAQAEAGAESPASMEEEAPTSVEAARAAQVDVAAAEGEGGAALAGQEEGSPGTEEEAGPSAMHATEQGPASTTPAATHATAATAADADDDEPAASGYGEAHSVEVQEAEEQAAEAAAVPAAAAAPSRNRSRKQRRATAPGSSVQDAYATRHRVAPAVAVAAPAMEEDATEVAVEEEESSRTRHEPDPDRDAAPDVSGALEEPERSAALEPERSEPAAPYGLRIRVHLGGRAARWRESGGGASVAAAAKEALEEEVETEEEAEEEEEVEAEEEEEAEEVEEEAPAPSEEADETYEIERILRRRKSNASKGETEAMYKVRWVGYGKRDDTWEPLANLLHTDALREFERGEVDETERSREGGAGAHAGSGSGGGDGGGGGGSGTGGGTGGDGGGSGDGAPSTATTPQLPPPGALGSCSTAVHPQEDDDAAVGPVDQFVRVGPEGAGEPDHYASPSSPAADFGAAEHEARATEHSEAAASSTAPAPALTAAALTVAAAEAAATTLTATATMATVLTAAAALTAPAAPPPADSAAAIRRASGAGRSHLRSAIRRGDLSRTLGFLHDPNEPPLAVNVLHKAVPHVPILEALLRHLALPPHGGGAPPLPASSLLLNALDPESGHTPLSFAVAHCQGDADATAATLLLAAGADPNVLVRNGSSSALAEACKHVACAPLLRALLAYGADPDLQTSEGYTPLMYAADYNNGPAIEVLAGARGDAGSAGRGGSAGLGAASSSDAGGAGVAVAEVELVDEEGLTALHWAALQGGAAALTALLAAGADSNKKTPSGERALDLTKKADCLAVLRAAEAAAGEEEEEGQDGGQGGEPSAAAADSAEDVPMAEAAAPAAADALPDPAPRPPPQPESVRAPAAAAPARKRKRSSSGAAERGGAADNLSAAAQEVLQLLQEIGLAGETGGSPPSGGGGGGGGATASHVDGGGAPTVYERLPFDSLASHARLATLWRDATRCRSPGASLSGQPRAPNLFLSPQLVFEGPLLSRALLPAIGRDDARLLALLLSSTNPSSYTAAAVPSAADPTLFSDHDVTAAQPPPRAILQLLQAAVDAAAASCVLLLCNALEVAYQWTDGAHRSARPRSPPLAAGSPAESASSNSSEAACHAISPAEILRELERLLRRALGADSAGTASVATAVASAVPAITVATSLATTVAADTPDTPNAADYDDAAAAAALEVPARRRVAQALLLSLCRTRCLADGTTAPPPPMQRTVPPPSRVFAQQSWPRRAVLVRPPEGGRREVLCGADLSEGAEPVPVRWVNATGDGALPDPFVYARHCVAFDASADAQAKPPRRCDGDGRHVGSPDGFVVECTAACGADSGCVGPRGVAAQRKRRQLQRGLAHRLEVFRHSPEGSDDATTGPALGWGLRTLELIQKGSFVIEYVGEHLSKREARRRCSCTADTDVYLMSLQARAAAATSVSIDALHVRNASAFANFSCQPNLELQAALAAHWDTRLPHAAFYATRDIEAGEELCFSRDDERGRDTDGQPVACRCGAYNCRGWI